VFLTTCTIISQALLFVNSLTENSAIPNSEIQCGCGTGLPSPQPSPKLGRGSKKLYFLLRLPFSQNWEKGLGDEGEGAGMTSIGFEFGIAAENLVSTYFLSIR
jgi:hypothetical protein